MAIRTIIVDGDPLLRKISKPVEKFDEKLHILLDDMKETMEKNQGVGLAAPQIGILRRIILVDDEKIFCEFINPEIIDQDGNQYGIEGCLSCPDEFGMVDRSNTVRVRGKDRYGKLFEIVATDLLARIIFHEIDHLNGILFKDIAKEMVDKKDYE
ncbi:MAG: peptide deformylase [Oscillospiraceae bacterium]|nr:peptide deformylase [Oscillospiraceae bacterium]